MEEPGLNNMVMLICTIVGTSLAVITSIIGAMLWMFRRISKYAVREYMISDVEKKVNSLKCDEHHESVSLAKERIEGQEKKISGLPCKAHAEKLSDHKSILNEHTKILNDNNKMLVELSKWAMKIDEKMIDNLAMKFSPLKMTRDGELLFAKSGADKALDAMKDELIELVYRSNPRTEYDVEQMCIEALLKNIGHEKMDDVKRFIYYSPEKMVLEDGGKEIRFDMYSIIRLMSIRLRDMYLEEHKEISSVNE